MSRSFEKKTTKLSTILLGLGLLTTILIIPIVAIVNGLIVNQLWEWFLLPGLGLEVPSLPITIGILTTISYAFGFDLLVKNTTDTFKDKKDLGELLVALWGWLLGRWATILILGYIIHLFA